MSLVWWYIVVYTYQKAAVTLHCEKCPFFSFQSILDIVTSLQSFYESNIHSFVHSWL